MFFFRDIFATVLASEAKPEAEAHHPLLTRHMAKLSLDRQQPFQILSGHHHLTNALVRGIKS